MNWNHQKGSRGSGIFFGNGKGGGEREFFAGGGREAEGGANDKDGNLLSEAGPVRRNT
jgi:hypothetical protein